MLKILLGLYNRAEGGRRLSLVISDPIRQYMSRQRSYCCAFNPLPQGPEARLSQEFEIKYSNVLEGSDSSKTIDIENE